MCVCVRPAVQRSAFTTGRQWACIRLKWEFWNNKIIFLTRLAFFGHDNSPRDPDVSRFQGDAKSSKPTTLQQATTTQLFNIYDVEITKTTNKGTVLLLIEAISGLRNMLPHKHQFGGRNNTFFALRNNTEERFQESVIHVKTLFCVKKVTENTERQAFTITKNVRKRN